MNKKFLFAIIIILTIVAYLPGINGDFLNWDDTIYILNNNSIQGNISFDTFTNFYDQDKNISLVLFSFLVQTKLTGTDPFFFHAFNILLHIINVFLAFKLFSLILKKEYYIYFATFLFAIHPLKVESVVWIMQRKDLMFSMFLLLSILSYISILRVEKWYKYLFLFAFSFLASISKVQSLILAPLLILCQYFILRKVTFRGIHLAITVFVLMITSLFSAHIYLLIVIFPFITIINIDKIQQAIDRWFFSLLNKFQRINNSLLMRKVLNYFILLALGLFVAYFLTQSLIILEKVIFKHSSVQSNPYDYNFYIKTIIYGLFCIFSLLALSLSISNSKLLNKSHLQSVHKILSSLISKIYKNWVFTLLFLLTLLAFITVCFKSYSGALLTSGAEHEVLLFLSLLITLEISVLFKSINVKFGFLFKIIISIILLALACLIFYVYVISGQNSIDNVSIINTLNMAIYSLSYYVLRFFYTFDLSAMNPYPISIVYAKYFYLGLGVLLLNMVVALRVLLLKKFTKEFKNGLIFGIVFFIITIFPVLHFIPIGGRVIVADRYTYLPYLGYIMFIVLLFGEFLLPMLEKMKGKIKFIMPLIFVLLFFFQTYSRSKVWQNDNVFWSDVIEKNAENHYAWFSRGLYYYQKGDYLNAKKDYDRAILLNEHDTEYFTNRGAVNVKLKRYANALDDLNKALILKSDNLLALKSRLILFLETGEIDLAYNDLMTIGEKYSTVFNNQIIKDDVLTLRKSKDNYDKTRGVEPKLSDYYYRIGSTYAGMNDFDSALKFFNLAMEYNYSNSAALMSRGNVYAMLKDFYNAKKDYYRLIGEANADCSVYLNLGNILHESGQVDSACNYWNVSRLKGCENAQIMLDKFCASEIVN